MTKQEMYRFTSKLYRRLRNPAFVFKLKRSKSFAGMWYSDKRIELNPDDRLIPTIVHEILHDIYPGKNHKWIYAKEREIQHQLSYRQMVNILFATAKALKRSISKPSKLFPLKLNK
jgi:hypothetical protein